MVDHREPQYLSAALTSEEEEIIFSTMRSSLKNISVYPTLGNHDQYPCNLIFQNSSGFATEFEWQAQFFSNLWTDQYEWIDEKAGKKMGVIEVTDTEPVYHRVV